MTRTARLVALGAIVALSGAATVTASSRTSTTFDEIIMLAGGARGWSTGQFDIQPDHPPLMLYLYGLPVALASPVYPSAGTAPPWRGPQGEMLAPDYSFRYNYSRDFFRIPENDAVRLAFFGRLVAAALAALTILAAYGMAVRAGGATAGLGAATLVAFLPDTLAHGGVAYNDLPFALAWLLSVWAADGLARNPTLRNAVVLGGAATFALLTKFGALSLLPVVGVLFLAEGFSQRWNMQWLGRFAGSALLAIAIAYVLTVAAYGGDLTLAGFRYGLAVTLDHVRSGHGAPAYLLGRLSDHGWWYFYPLAFLLKTPLQLHLLIVMACGSLIAARRDGFTDMLRSPLRAPLAGLLVYGTGLITSNLAIGFRHALPAVLLLLILTAVGIAHLWERFRTPARLGIGVLLLWYAVSVITWWPHFLSYTSEYAGGRDRGHRFLLDSSLDWGQGLVELRDWMRRERVDRVALSYFGSADPVAYDIGYTPLPSFFTLPGAHARSTPEPRYVVVSATNLHGVYLRGDPFAPLRAIVPHAVLAHSMMVYKVGD